MAVKAAALKARPTWAEIITCPMGLVRVGMSIGFTTRPISAVAISGPIIQGSGRSSRLNRYPATDAHQSEERRAGKEWRSKCRYRWDQYHYNKKTKIKVKTKTS